MPPPERHRSPAEVALLPGGRLALTANHTADTVSLIDLHAGKVLAERPGGRRPVAVACSRDGRRAAVSNLWSHTVSLFTVADDTLQPAGEVAVGSQPRGLAFTLDGQTLFAAVSGADEVVRIDFARRTVTHRWPAPREPRVLALSPDGNWLAAAGSRAAEVCCWDTRTGRRHWQRPLGDAFNLHGLAFTPDGRDVICSHVVRRSFPVAKGNIEKGWVTDSRLTRLALAAQAEPATWQVALDTQGEAVGDPQGVALSKDGRVLAVAAGGTHELLLLEAAAVPWNGGEPGDFIDAVLLDGRKLRRIELGGRPMAVAFTDDGTRAVVANYLLDAVQVVDVAAGKLVRAIPLGGPARLSPERRGEALFYDAQRSHNQWFSCHTCHPDGHTCGRTFDTLNDESYGNAKLTPSLRGVARTGPWTWHGWQQDLGASVEKSLTETLFGPNPTTEDVAVLVAFLKTLDHPPRPPAAAAAAVRRGRAIFHGKARCDRCHQGEQYTSAKNYDVGLEDDNSGFPKWNPPSLRGLSDRGPYLHDGRADTLEEVLKEHHQPEKLGGQALTPAERQDLIAFLRSL